MRYEKARLGNLASESDGQWQARAGAAAFDAYADLPADADHDDVDRPPHLGFLLLAWWLVAIASDPKAYATVSGVFASLTGQVLLFLFSWALIHHMLGGIRHLVWDTGRALDKTSIEVLAWLTIIGSITLTVLIWYVGYTVRGGV